MDHYYSLNEYYRKKFGEKVYKLSISAFVSCPNRDGTIDTRGCIFCSKGGSGEFAECRDMSVERQLELARLRVAEKTNGGAYIAYFQPFSNTYADIGYLRKIYYEAIKPDYIVGLSIATRPDCLGDDVLRLLEEVNSVKPVSVELGLQTVYEDTARYIRRGYPLSVYDDAVKKLRAIDVDVVTHIILGLPFETDDMMLESVRYASAVSDGIKLHLLYVTRGTDLETEYKRGVFDVLSLEKYADLICRAVEMIPPDVVIHRITGDGAKRDLIAPLWSGDKKKVLNYIRRVMDERSVRQGAAL